MLKRLVAGVAAAIVAGGLIAPAAVAAPHDTVSIPDAELKACVNDALGQEPDADVTKAQLETLTTFECDALGITDVEGLTEAIAESEAETEAEGATDGAADAGTKVPSDDDATGEGADATADAPESTEESREATDHTSTRDTPVTGTARATSGTIVVPDAAFKECINDFLDQAPNAEITEAQMASLTELNCDRGDISDITGIEFATSLPVLDISWNPVSDLTPVAALTNLKELQFRGTQVTDLTPVSGLTSLVKLDFNEGRVSDLTPIAGLTSLKKLVFSYNKVSDLSPLAELTNLDVLVFNFNQVSDLTPLSGLTKMRALTFGANHVADLTPLADMSHMTFLAFPKNRVAELSALAGMTRLEEVRLQANRVPDLSPLSQLPALSLVVARGQMVSQAKVAAGTPVANPLRSYDGSVVKPTDTSLCADANCERLVYTTAGEDVRAEWSTNDDVVFFSGTISRGVTQSANASGSGELANTGADIPAGLGIGFGVAATLVAAGITLLTRRARTFSASAR